VSGEVAVIGLGRSGGAAVRLLRAQGLAVYASDAGRGEVVEDLAAELRAIGASVDVGVHDLARIGKASACVVSPGVPPDAAPLAVARQVGVPIHSEIELALGAIGSTRYIATTGTNGKTTVTALIAHLLRAVGVDADEAGNIGTPLAEIVLREKRPDWVALELSSFQLHDTPSVNPAVALLTNLAPDHLDRYPDLESYYADKDLLFRNAHAASVRVVNADDAEVMRRTANVAGQARRFSVQGRDADAWYDATARRLMLNGEALLERDALPLLGIHNVANALAASLAVHEAVPEARGASGRAKLAAGLKTFVAPPHRLEKVGEFGGILWVNDSKATNVGAARVAIEAMERPTVLLLGGRHKGEPYSNLLAAMQGRVKVVIAYGESEPIIVEDLAGHVPVERCGSSFDEVIARARALAVPGDTVLLAPACSSYDMFKNYDERGAVFRAKAREESRT
jgi:UDP-N-acetylmuramoylalanine--D-glutamate ligase